MSEAKVNYLDVHVSFLIFLHFNFYLISFYLFFYEPNDYQSWLRPIR